MRGDASGTGTGEPEHPRRRRGTAALLAGAAAASLALVHATPATAAPPPRPTHEVVQFPEDGPGTGPPPFLDSACERLGIEVDAVITFLFTDRATTFYDRAGDPVRVRVPTVMDATIVNTRNGRTLDADAVRVVTQDLADGTVTLHGVRFRYSAPGEGTLFLTAGRWPIVPPGEFSGRDDFGDPERFRAVCTYCAGG